MSAARNGKKHSSNHHRKGFGAITVVFSVLLLSTFGLSMNPIWSTASRNALLEMNSQKAFYAAQAGMQYALAKEFRGNFDFTTASRINNKAFGGGLFSVTYSNVTASTADVTVTAQVEGSVRVIRQSVKSAMIRDGMHAGGNVNLESKQSGGGTIIGDMSCGGSCSYDGGYTHIGSMHSGVDSPPAIDLQPYKDMTTSAHDGNFTINGDFSGNIYVTGNVTISGSGIITGIIVADGNVIIDADHSETRDIFGTIAADGNIEIDFKHTSAGLFEPQEALPLFVTNGNIVMGFKQQSTVTFRGLLQSDGNIEMELKQRDIVNIEGALSANGNIDIESKQQTVINVDLTAGAAYMDNEDLELSNWEEL